MRILYVVLLASIVSTVPLDAETYEIDSEHSQVAFDVRHMVSRAHGLFNEFSGQIQYDPEHPEKIQIDATISVASIDTDNEKRDAHLRSADFFDVESHPSITFKSTGAEIRKDMLHVTGDFTLHGITRRIVLPVTVMGIGTNPWTHKAQVGMEASTVRSRAEYGVDTWSDVASILGDEVQVRLMVQANAQ